MNPRFELRGHANHPQRTGVHMTVGSIGYEVRGREHGTPLLLIRPLGGSMALWGTFRTLLEEQFRVISFDLRGVGRSSPADEWSTTRRLAVDALRVLNELEVDEANVFGLSLGGMIATWMGILAPTRVRKLCVASAPARGFELRGSGLRRGFQLAACFARRDVEVCLVHRMLSASFQAQNPDAVRSIDSMLRLNPTPRGTLLDLALASVLHDTGGKLHRIRATTLVLAGQNDKLLGPDCSRVLARAIPRAQFEIIPDSGHDLTLEQPELTADRVTRFLRSRS
jgi:pimeloyl-ACP methyl ester carboxylesterase